jgi:hypothetical protein
MAGPGAAINAWSTFSRNKGEAGGNWRVLMYSEFMLMQMDKDRQQGCQQRAARERLYRQATGKQSFECLICNQLATLLLRIGKKLKELAQIKESDNLPVSEEQLIKMFNLPPDSIFT